MSFKGRLAFAEVPSSEDELVALFGVNEFPSLLVCAGVLDRPVHACCNKYESLFTLLFASLYRW